MVNTAHQNQQYRHIVFPPASRRLGETADFSRGYIRGSEPCGIPLVDDEQAFLTELFERGGLSLGDYRPETLQRRMPACLRALHAVDAQHARVVILRNPSFLATALSALVIGVTDFFRDPLVFQALSTRLAGLCCDERPLAVWSAGCSDGAELYSMAIMLDELGVLSRSKLVGTDCRWDAILRARTGRFSANAIQKISAERVSKYFNRCGEAWSVSRRLMASVDWRLGNIMAHRPVEMWDVIFCRNLAIYLKPDSVAALWHTLVASLRPGGLLVLGPAEKPAGFPQLVQHGSCIYQKIVLGNLPGTEIKS